MPPSIPPDRFVPTLPPALVHDAVGLAYARNPDRFRPGHRITLLGEGADAYADMLHAIETAERYVHMETYIFEPDRAGMTFLAALALAAGRGVAVRLTVDAIGSWNLQPSHLREAREAGVEIVIFRPLRRLGRRRGKRRLRGILRRNHRKMLVIDGTTAFVGGMNITVNYVPTESTKVGWRDLQLRVQGPCVGDLDRLFRETWISAQGKTYAIPSRPADECVATSDTVRAAVVTSDDRGRRSSIRKNIVHALRHARDNIDISNPYFLPDAAFRRELVAAVKRGVRVGLTLSARSDIATAQLASEHLYLELLSAGVQISLWNRSHLHEKLVVVDGLWFSVGSYNLDHLSLFRNFEVVVEGIGTQAATRLANHCRQAGSIPLTIAAWRKRSIARRLLSWLAYRLRRWL